MTIGLIKYCFQLSKLSNILFQNMSVCLYLTFESSNRASLIVEDVLKCLRKVQKVTNQTATLII